MSLSKGEEWAFRSRKGSDGEKRPPVLSSFGLTGYRLKFFLPGIGRDKRKADGNVGPATTGARTKCPQRGGECALALLWRFKNKRRFIS